MIFGEKQDVVIDPAATLPLAGLLRLQCFVEAASFGDDVRLASDDRFEAGLLRFPVELERAEHHAVIGERDGRHLVLNGSINDTLNRCGTVEKTVMGVIVEMDELGHNSNAGFK